MRFQDCLSFWLLLATGVFTLFYACVRPLWFLLVATLKPPTMQGASSGFLARLFGWLGHREWYVVFVVANAAVFWLSMTSVANWRFPETFIDNYVVALQLLMMVAAIQRVLLSPSKIHRRVVLDFNDATMRRWIWSCMFGIAANLLALMDSVQRFVVSDVSSRKFWIWFGMDTGAILFFAVILVLVWRRLYAAAKSRWMSLLWLDIGVLVWLTIRDMTTPGK